MSKSKGRKLAEWLRNLNAQQRTGTDGIADTSITFAKLHTALVVTESEGIGNSDNDTTLATNAAIVDYVANNTPAGYSDSDVATYLSTNGYDTATNIIATISDSAPTTLDTLNELAAALGDDANFATTTATQLSAKANLSGATFTGGVTISGGTSDFDVASHDGATNGLKLGGVLVTATAAELNKLDGVSTLWHSGNDGSGSGLDADTLDGIQASGFVRGDGTADPFTMDVGRGDMYVENNSNDNQSGSGVTFRTASNPTSGSESANPGSMFCVRSSGQASRLWVGQSITSTGSNSFETNTITASGNITAYSSDKRLKKDFEVIPNALDKVMQISGYTFKWNDLTQEVGFTAVKPDQKDIGVVAQEIQEVLPEVVDRAPFDSYEDTDGIRKSKSGDDYLTVRYDRIVPLLIEAIKEQQAQIEELKKKIQGE